MTTDTRREEMLARIAILTEFDRRARECAGDLALLARLEEEAEECGVKGAGNVVRGRINVVRMDRLKARFRCPAPPKKTPAQLEAEIDAMSATDRERFGNAVERLARAMETGGSR